MGADIKLLRTRIRSVNSTLHLTKAMGLVASSKIRRATEAMLYGRQYAESVSSIVRSLSRCSDCQKSPYMRNSHLNSNESTDGRVRLIVIAGDRGLAGGYNANIFRFAKQYSDAEIIPIGKRSCERYSVNSIFKSCFKNESEEANANGMISSENFPHSLSKKLALTLCRDFADGKYDRLGILHTEYISLMTQIPKVTWLLPLEKDESAKDIGILFEPNESDVLKAAVPEYIAGMITYAVRESFACEVAARRLAMDSAGKNAQQMIDDLQLQYNRARQSAITQEITEIVAGSGS